MIPLIDECYATPFDQALLHMLRNSTM